MPATYMSGALARTIATFTNIAGAATDPTTVVLKYQDGPNGAVTSVTYPASPIVKDSTGVYHADLDTTSWQRPGSVIVEWIGTGALQAIGTDTWQIIPEPL